MKTIFGAFALYGIAFALSGNAAGQTLIGEWQLVKTFCEGGEVLGDWSKTNNRLIFDKVSATRIIDRSNMYEQYKRLCVTYQDKLFDSRRSIRGRSFLRIDIT